MGLQMEMREREVKEAIEIDPERLDEGWLEQAPMYLGYARAMAGARQDVDRARQTLLVITAKAEMEIRAAPENYGISKVTESAIKSALVLDGNVGNAETTVLDLTYKVSVLTAILTALDHRKKALSDLVQLHITEYSYESKSPDVQVVGDLEEEDEE